MGHGPCLGQSINFTRVFPSIAFQNLGALRMLPEKASGNRWKPATSRTLEPKDARWVWLSSIWLKSTWEITLAALARWQMKGIAQAVEQQQLQKAKCQGWAVHVRAKNGHRSPMQHPDLQWNPAPWFCETSGYWGSSTINVYHHKRLVSPTTNQFIDHLVRTIGLLVVCI